MYKENMTNIEWRQAKMDLLLLFLSTTFIKSTWSWGKQVIQQAKAIIHLAFIASIKRTGVIG